MAFNELATNVRKDPKKVYEFILGYSDKKNMTPLESLVCLFISIEKKNGRELARDDLYNKWVENFYKAVGVEIPTIQDVNGTYLSLQKRGLIE